jgi:hypothetical protein
MGELLNRASHERLAAEDAACRLEASLDRLAERHYDARRPRVDYGGAAVSEDYQGMRHAVGALAGIDPGELADAGRATAFWINVYNALVLHIILAGSIAASVRERDDFFTGPHYCVGPYEMTLDAIEHGFLRGNARKYLGLKPQFARDDPRLKWTLKRPDPRVHFGLYTAAVSSPHLRVIPRDNANASLERATREHLDQSVRRGNDGDTVCLPRLFRWYTGDFGGSLDDALAFVRARLSDERAEALAQEDIDVEFSRFEWRLNDRYTPLT